MAFFRGIRGMFLALTLFLISSVSHAELIQLVATDMCHGNQKDLRVKGDGMCDHNPWGTKRRMPLPQRIDDLDDLWCKYLSHNAQYRDWQVVIPNGDVYQTWGCGISFLDNLRGQCGWIRKWTCEYVGKDRTTYLLSFRTSTACWLTQVDWSMFLGSGHQVVRTGCRRYLDPLPWVKDGDDWYPQAQWGNADLANRYKFTHIHPPEGKATPMPLPAVDMSNPWVNRFNGPPLRVGMPTWKDIDYNSCTWYRWKMGNGGIKRSFRWLISITHDDRYDRSGCGKGFLDNIRGECGPVLNWECLFVGPDKNTAYISFSTYPLCTAEKVEAAIYKASYQEIEMICLHDWDHLEAIDLFTDPYGPYAPASDRDANG